MHIADEDPELATCGYIISRTGLLPTDPRFKDLIENPLLMAFTYHWLQKHEEMQVQVLWKALGVYWTWEDIQETPNAGPQHEMFVPLSIALNQDSKGFRKFLRHGLKPRPQGKGAKKTKQGYVELGELSKENFLKWTQAALGAAGVTLDISDELKEAKKDPDKT